MLGVALQGIPREDYQLMSKVTTREGTDPRTKIDELRRLARTEYVDVMLLHWQHTGDWPIESGRWADGISEAQARKVVLGRGASVHGTEGLAEPGAALQQRVASVSCPTSLLQYSFEDRTSCNRPARNLHHPGSGGTPLEVHK
jgi:aryl-alcohol dehydrogenase-like predicted oxidoreductase